MNMFLLYHLGSILPVPYLNIMDPSYLKNVSLSIESLLYLSVSFLYSMENLARETIHISKCYTV